MGVQSRSDRLEAAEVKPGTEKHDGNIEEAKSDENAEIKPLMGVEDVESFGLKDSTHSSAGFPKSKNRVTSETYIFIASGILAELAKAVGSILDIAARRADEGFGVALASLARRRGEARKLACGTDDFPVVNGDAEKSFEQVVKWGKVVHPRFPKVGQHRIWHHDTTEGNHEQEKYGHQQTR